MESLFHAALERPAEEREAFLRAACGSDDDLYEEVVGLVTADGTGHSVLDGRAVDAIGAPPVPPPTTLAEGARVGPYRVVGVVGAGGMGVVYRAERADGQFEQIVALKLIKRGMDSDLILSRFHSERRILARLQHPNIANLLDGGVNDDGLPYFTMEYIDGQPITRYCDERDLSIEERLELFLSVCAAVQYAHGNLVVHRDLKPSNILVTSDGHVKLLDFGIARVLGEDDEGLTRSGQRVMTPAYASPEQVRGEPVTTASDVYSLGVVLYELLCGRHPHRDTTSTPAELERAIAESPADRPSRFATRGEDATGTSPSAIARARRLPPARLRKRLVGDLDNICLVALRKEPERRYSSPGQLLEDISRHLTGRPISARPDTVRYRFGKFVGRNRVAVTATAAAVVLAMAMTAVYTVNLARERDRARLEARKAAEVSTFLSGLFKAADPYTSRGETITAREMLDEGRDRVHNELADQPGVLSDMLKTIGTAYGNLGAYDDAVAALRESIALGAGLEGERSGEVVETTVALMTILNEMGRYEEADSLGRRVVEDARDLPDKKTLAGALGALATTSAHRGRYDEAERLYREGIENWRRVEGRDSPGASPVMNDLALLLHEQSRYAEADTLFERALAIQEKAYGVRHPETATTRYNYAQLLGDEGHLSEAHRLWDEVLATDRALYPEGHPAIAFTLSAYGRMLARIGEFEEAERLQREALDIRRKFHGDENPDVAYSLGSLGRLLLERGYYDEAEARLREALALQARVSGPRHPVLGNLKNSIGFVQYARGDYAAADTSFARALAFLRSVAGGKELNQMFVSMVGRALVLAATGKTAGADTLAREGLAFATRLHGDQGEAVGWARVQLALVLLRAGRVQEADTLFADGLARMRALENDAPQRPRDCDALVGLGRCRLAEGDVADADARSREALDVANRYFRAGHPKIARAQITRAAALMARGDPRAAEPLLRSAIETLSPVVLPGQVDLAEAKRELEEVTR